MSNIIPIERRAAAPNASSLQFKIEAYQRATRCISSHVTPAEFAVFMQILDRTVGWGVRETSFTSHAARKGDSIYNGIQISRATWFRALASLEEKCIIRRRTDARFPDKRHYSVNLEWEPEVAGNLLMRLKDPSHCETTPSHRETLYTGNPNTDNPTTGNPGAPSGDAIANSENDTSGNPVASITARAARAGQATKDARFAKVERGKARGNASGIETAWRAAVSETFPGHPVPTWTVREKGQAATAAKKWIEPDQTFSDFIEWAARNWTQIMAKQFRWMTKSPPPKVPSTAFLYNFMDQFIECHAEGKLDAWQNSRERNEIEQAMARGATYEEAMKVVAKREVAGAMREEIEKREAEINRKARAARNNVERAKKIVDYGAAPVHPQSIEGLKRRPRRAPVAPAEDFPEVAPPLPLNKDRELW